MGRRDACRMFAQLSGDFLQAVVTSSGHVDIGQDRDRVALIKCWTLATGSA
jgi:hypothetical protein